MKKGDNDSIMQGEKKAPSAGLKNEEKKQLSIVKDSGADGTQIHGGRRGSVHLPMSHGLKETCGFRPKDFQKERERGRFRRSAFDIRMQYTKQVRSRQARENAKRGARKVRAKGGW